MKKAAQAAFFVSKALKVLAFQLDIPIEIVHPGFMQVMWREASPHILELVIARLARLPVWVHVDLIWHAPTFFQITRAAGCNDIVPAGNAAA